MHEGGRVKSRLFLFWINLRGNAKRRAFSDRLRTESVSALSF
ncbi:MAG: hypothetical protein RL077_2938 [Verrucomicrobiota bacterium]